MRFFFVTVNRICYIFMISINENDINDINCVKAISL